MEHNVYEFIYFTPFEEQFEDNSKFSGCSNVEKVTCQRSHHCAYQELTLDYLVRRPMPYQLGHSDSINPKRLYMLPSVLCYGRIMVNVCL